MQIKQQALAQQIQKKIAPIYLLIGQDNYLIQDGLNTIKAYIKKSFDCDEKIITVQSSDDWNTLLDEANSYSLFSETVFLNILYDKKSIDASGKKVLSEYVKSINPKCFIVIRAPNIPAKQLLWITNNEHVVVVVAYPYNSGEIKSWISNQLKNCTIQFEEQVPELIHQYTQGNMLACAQVIEKISLCVKPDSRVSSQQVLEHLSDQSNHSLYELVDSCLSGDASKAVHILRQAANNKTEATLVLWMLAQEIRLLLQLTHLVNQQHIELKAASSQLKLWPQRTYLYQSSMKRLNNKLLEQLLKYCQAIDEQIKSNLNTQVWNSFEKLALALCFGNFSGVPCIV